MSRKRARQFEFIVIAGELKGRRVTAPDLGVTRPPLSRLRKSIFDFLTPHLAGARYLDLFSGTGSYLFEAVSRGAACAVGVEREPALVEAVNRQADEFHVADRLRCLQRDVQSALPELADQGQKFDIIMIAPPQYQGLIDPTLAAIRTCGLAGSQGLIVCQHDTSETRELRFEDYPVAQQRKYGNTTFTILSA
ncbi:MAG TPA: RsmD family RNA methyltransferase [Acidobacteriota bacterium]|nr:RsmD family RNA methyltransferase [Acidobacteriota bacterium]